MAALWKVIIFIFSTTPVWAKSTHFELNEGLSKIEFKVGHLTFSSQEGSFAKFNGSALYDLHEKVISELKVFVEAKSIDTKNEERDEHLRNADFFHIKKFPKISFLGESFEYSSQQIPVKIHGKLTIKDLTKKVTFSVSSWNPSEKSIKFIANTKIYRREFGIRYGVFAAIGNQVTITVRAVATPNTKVKP